MRRRYTTLDIVRMYSTLTMDHWRDCLQGAMRKGNVEKLVSWRYGLQAGIHDAVKAGLSNEKLEIWAFKRIKDTEKAMRYILKQKYKNPIDDAHAKKDPSAYVQKALLAKRARDKAFELFLQQSSF